MSYERATTASNLLTPNWHNNERICETEAILCEMTSANVSVIYQGPSSSFSLFFVFRWSMGPTQGFVGKTHNGGGPPVSVSQSVSLLFLEF